MADDNKDQENAERAIELGGQSPRIGAQDYSSNTVLQNRQISRRSRSVSHVILPISIYPEEENYNREIPFYSNRADKLFVEHLTLLNREECAEELKKVNNSSIVFDLTHGLKGKKNTTVLKLKPILFNIIFVILSIPGFVTNNYLLLLPSLLISFGLILFCILYTDWNAWRDAKPALMRQNEAAIDRLREKVAKKSALRSRSASPRVGPVAARSGAAADNDTVVAGGDSSGGNGGNGGNGGGNAPSDDFKLDNNNNNNNNNNESASGKKRAQNMRNATQNNGIKKANANRYWPLNAFTYNIENYDDYASYLFDFQSIDKGDALNHDEGSVVPRYIQWFLLIGQFAVLLLMFLTQYKSYIDNDDRVWLSRCDDYESSDVDDGSCLLRHGVVSCCIAFYGYAAFVSIFVLLIPSIDSQKLKFEVEETLKIRFPKRALHKMEAIEAASQKATLRIIDYKCICGDKNENNNKKNDEETENDEENPRSKCGFPYLSVVLTLLCVIVSMTATYVADSQIFWEVKTNKVGSYLIYIYSRFIVAFFLYRSTSECWLINHMFIRDWIAMESLGGAMYFSHVSDVVCWYEMRSFYTDYQQPIQSGGRASPPFACLLIGSLIGGIYALVRIYGGSADWLQGDPDGAMTAAVIIVSLGYMLLYMYTSVATYQLKVGHIEALKHEILRLKTLQSTWMQQNEDDSDAKNPFSATINTVEAVTTYLSENDSAPTIIGIPMTTGVLITGAGYVIGSAGSIVGFFPALFGS